MAEDGQIPVTFAHTITQVVENEEYNGTLEYGGTKLDFRIVFPEGVFGVDTRGGIKTPEEMREFSQLTLTKSGEELMLSDKEYASFLAVIGSAAYTFAKNAQVAELGVMVLGPYAILLNYMDLDVEVSASITRTLNVSRVMFAQITHPKFGANLSAV